MARRVPWYKRLQDPRDVRAATVFAAVLLAGEAALSVMIIYRVACEAGCVWCAVGRAMHAITAWAQYCLSGGRGCCSHHTAYQPAMDHQTQHHALHQPQTRRLIGWRTCRRSPASWRCVMCLRGRAFGVGHAVWSGRSASPPPIPACLASSAFQGGGKGGVLLADPQLDPAAHLPSGAGATSHAMHPTRTPQGERDYKNLRGDTGPLVYPAGFVYVFSALRWLTGGGVRAAQCVFAGLYLLTQAAVMALYIRARSLPPWALVTLCLSRRLHSIFLLRLFNDCWAMLLTYAATLLLQVGWGVGGIGPWIAAA